MSLQPHPCRVVRRPEDDSDAPDPCPPAEDASAPATELEGRPECGEELYASICATCHGDDGHGTDLAPDLRVHVPHHADLELILILSNGTGDMPDPKLEAQEVSDVLVYLRDTFE